MRPLRLLVSLTSCVIAITFLLYLSVSEPSDISSDDPDSDSKKTGLGSLFSFHGPLFPPSAVISLTDDNSTFFLARPAAFGPLLPSSGLSGQLWIGSGFASNSHGQNGLEISSEGELGCGDVPDWDERFRDEEGDPVLDGDITKPDGFNEKGPATDVETSVVALHERTDIAGKIVLLSRGGCGFLDKIQWAQSRGGVAVIVGDNIRGGPIITMYARGDTSNISIPALFTSRMTAHLLSTLVPSGGSLGAASNNHYHRNHVVPSVESAFPHDDEAPDLDSVQSGKSWIGTVRSFLGLANKQKKYTESLLDRWRNRGHQEEKQELPVSSGMDGAIGSSSGLRAREDYDWRLDPSHNGLWVTLTPANMSSNPFLDTLLVLVVSPLVTLTVVYALLLLRSRMQRRRWRAPKSVVDRLPVRTYHTLPGSASQLATPMASSPTTPLLQCSQRSSSQDLQSVTRAAADVLDHPSSSDPRQSTDSMSHEHEKVASGLEEWRRRYGGRQRECVVCLEEYVDGVSRVMSLPCGHEFHAECITPWLTTRRRTCPICKGDVVRSIARRSRHPRSRSPQRSALAARRHNRSRQVSESRSSGEDSAGNTDEDVQTQAATRRNDSPSAAMPIPIVEIARHGDGDEDLERGADLLPTPEPRPRVDEPALWRRLGLVGLAPVFSGSSWRSRYSRFGSRDDRDDRRRR